MSERNAFLNAIRENPDDDTVRLVFADWLDDRGNPLAELIRVQIELEPIRDQLDSPRAQELTHRESILLATHGHEWLGAAADIASEYPAFGPVFRRGMPEMVCLSLDTFLRRGAELFQACPTVREVSLYGVEPRGRDLLAFALLEKVETLEIADWIEEEDLFENGIGMLQHVRRFRLWGDLDHFLPDALTDAATAGWPDLIEVVDLDDSRVRFGDARGAIFNERIGRELIRVGKPFEARFPIARDVGHGLYPGINDEGELVLLTVREDHSGVWITFQEDGQSEDAATFGSISREEIEHWRTSHGRSIHVRELDYLTIGFSIHLWPRAYVRDFFRRPFDRPPGVSDHWWNSRGGVLRRWLHEGRFVIEWDGREYTLDASGKIIASEAVG